MTSGKTTSGWPCWRRIRNEPCVHLSIKQCSTPTMCCTHGGTFMRLCACGSTARVGMRNSEIRALSTHQRTPPPRCIQFRPRFKTSLWHNLGSRPNRLCLGRLSRLRRHWDHQRLPDMALTFQAPLIRAQCRSWWGLRRSRPLQL